MLGTVKTINGQKQIVPLTPEVQSGAPLGTIIAIYSNVVPDGYLPCNGVAFDENQYPALYAMLGDNHTPYSYDKSRLGDYESITISTDVNSPTVMQFDGFITLQSASTLLELKVLDNPALGTAPNVYTVYSNTNTNYATGTFPLRKGDRFYISTGIVQNSAVRYYKHFNCIKATSGLSESQQDYVLDALLEAGSYSTEEVATGKKWIDGKMIYRRTFYSSTNSFSSSTQFSVPNCDVIVQYGNMYRVGYSAFYGVVQKYNSGASTYLELLDWNAGNWTLGTSWWVEYTKSS